MTTKADFIYCACGARLLGVPDEEPRIDQKMISECVERGQFNFHWYSHCTLTNPTTVYREATPTQSWCTWRTLR